MRFYFLCIFLSLSTLIAGCANVSPTPKPLTKDKNAVEHLAALHLKEISVIKAFNMQGRMGLQASGKGFSGQLRWEHQPEKDHLVFYSPLGGQVAVIDKTPEQVTLTDAKGNVVSANDLASLTQTALGWSLPLEGLIDWSLGRPSSAAIQLNTWDENGHLLKLKQDNWDIDYQSYVNVDNMTLPNRLTLRRENIYLKLIIDSWSELN